MSDSDETKRSGAGAADGERAKRSSAASLNEGQAEAAIAGATGSSDQTERGSAPKLQASSFKQTYSGPPQIFSPRRRALAIERAMRLQKSGSATDFLSRRIAEDIIERLAFMRLQPRRALVVGDLSGELEQHLKAQGCDVTAAHDAHRETEQNFPEGDFDFIAHLVELAVINDVPGTLVRMRPALAADGVAIVSFPGAGSAARLRAALLAADGERPAARVHPQIDAPSGAALMQRAGFSRQVADSYPITVRYSSLAQLVEDHRAQGLGNVLASPPPPLTKASWHKAQAAFMGEYDAMPKEIEHKSAVASNAAKQSARSSSSQNDTAHNSAEENAATENATTKNAAAHKRKNTAEHPLKKSANNGTLASHHPSPNRVEEVYEIITLTGWK